MEERLYLSYLWDVIDTCLNYLSELNAINIMSYVENYTPGFYMDKIAGLANICYLQMNQYIRESVIILWCNANKYQGIDCIW